MIAYRPKPAAAESKLHPVFNYVSLFKLLGINHTADSLRIAEMFTVCKYELFDFGMGVCHWSCLLNTSRITSRDFHVQFCLGT